MNEPNETAVRHAQAVKDAWKDELRDIPGFSGVGITTADVMIKVNFEKEEDIPPDFPREVNGIPVKIDIVGTIISY